jgi:hypothetical protein
LKSLASKPGHGVPEDVSGAQVRDPDREHYLLPDGEQHHRHPLRLGRGRIAGGGSFQEQLLTDGVLARATHQEIDDPDECLSWVLQVWHPSTNRVVERARFESE